MTFHPYKMELHQLLSAEDHKTRLKFARLHVQLVADPAFLDSLLFSDESHFELHGGVNRHNFRYWSDHNPHWYREAPLHSPRFTVWAAIGKKGVIGPVFTRENVNGQLYLRWLQEVLLPTLQRMGIADEVRYMQDGAPPHWSKEVRAWLDQNFYLRWIGRESAMYPWPPRSPDLTPCDFFLWGYVKSKVYTTQPKSLDDLQRKIQKVFDELPQEMIDRAIDNYAVRLQKCIQVEGKSVE
jgi:hypothetical protein